MKKLISFLICILLLFTFCSCNNTAEEEEDVSFSFAQDNNTSNLTLAYTKSDSLNPYEAKSQINSRLTTLVFDGLYKLDSSYEPHPCIAKSYSFNGLSVSVTLDNVFFSDGTRVQPSDVEYSFYAAKDSDYYASRLDNFLELYVSGDNIIMITMEKADPYAVSCLDFPIVKNKPVKDDDEEEELPVGSGRYKYVRDGENLYLIVNTNRANFNPAIKTVALEAVHDSEYLDSSLVVGNTAVFLDDLSSGKYNRINATTVEMGINSEVFLGLNPHTSFFIYPEVRQAISLAIDRDEAVSRAFQSHARGALLPFNPDWYAVSSISFENSSGLEKAKELIEESGIDTRSEELIITYNYENGFKKDLAMYVEECLEKLGFIVRTLGVEASSFRTELQYGNYDIYIGEFRLTQNMDLSPLFSGSVSYGMAEDSESAARYQTFLEGGCEIIDFINTFNSEVPFVPVCFRNAVVSYTRAIYGDFAPCDSDLFYDIDSWSIR